MKLLSLFVLSIFFFISCNDDQQNKVSAGKEPKDIIEEGAHLFKINCNQCHMPAKDFAAPALAGVEKRWKDKELLYEFVRNSPSVIKKDKYAAELFIKWKQAPMLPMPHLSDEDIDAIFAYCNSVQ